MNINGSTGSDEACQHWVSCIEVSCNGWFLVPSVPWKNHSCQRDAMLPVHPHFAINQVGLSDTTTLQKGTFAHAVMFQPITSRSVWLSMQVQYSLRTKHSEATSTSVYLKRASDMLIQSWFASKAALLKTGTLMFTSVLTYALAVTLESPFFLSRIQ